MLRKFKPYIPQTSGELVDQLGAMMLTAPTFVDSSGFFPYSVETEFISLNGGLDAIRKKLGEEKYLALRKMSDAMRKLFEADPDDVTGETRQGLVIIDEMQQMLMNRRKPK